MKKTYISLTLLLVLWIAVDSTRILHGNSGGSPGSRTGAPKVGGGNESTCATAGCHGTNLNNGPHNTTITIAGDPEFFEPGQTYSVTAAIVNPTGTAAGFQLVALDPALASSGTFTAGAGNKILPGTRTYMTHTNQSNRSWTFSWTAPAAATAPDSVTFYVATNERIGQFFVTTRNKVFRKNVSTSVSTPQAEAAFRIYPTVAENSLFLTGKRAGIQPVSAAIFSRTGQQVGETRSLSIGEAEEIPVRDLTPGWYTLRVQSPAGSEIHRFIKN